MKIEDAEDPAKKVDSKIPSERKRVGWVIILGLMVITYSIGLMEILSIVDSALEEIMFQ